MLYILSCCLPSLCNKVGKVLVVSLIYLLLLFKGDGCQLRYAEEPPSQLNCRPFNNATKWRLRLACEVRTIDTSLPYTVHWFQRNIHNIIIHHHDVARQKSSTVERVIFGGDWIDDSFTDEMIGDYWCQAIPSYNESIQLTKSTVLAIRNISYYNTQLPVCSGPQFIRHDVPNRCISIVNGNIVPNANTYTTLTSSFISTTNTISVTSTNIRSVVSTSIIRSVVLTNIKSVNTKSMTSTMISISSYPLTLSPTHTSSAIKASSCTSFSNSLPVECSSSVINIQRPKNNNLLFIIIGIGCGSTIVLLIITIFIMIANIICKRRMKDKQNGKYSK